MQDQTNLNQENTDMGKFKWDKFCENGIQERMDDLHKRREALVKTRHTQKQLDGIDYMVSEYEREMMDRGYWQ